ncbi:MAG: TolB family protein [Chloroflexota bacterium]
MSLSGKPNRRLPLALLLAALLLVAGCPSPQPAPTATAPAAASPTATQGITPIVPTATASLATPTAAPSATPASTPTVAATATPLPRAEAGDIAFVLQGNLWLMGADGQGARRLTADGGYATPRWSPNGSRLAFIQGQGARARLGLINPDGSGKVMLPAPANAADSGPVWSPRATALAFTRVTDSNGDTFLDLNDAAEVWLVDADGANPRRLAAGRDPAWAPEGLRLAFATNGTLSSNPPYRRDNAINIVNTLGQNEWTLFTVAKVPAEITVGGGFTLSPSTTLLKSPSWRADGQRLAFTTQGHTGLVLTVSIGATDLRVVDSSYEGGFGRALYAPVGDLLAYEAQPPSGVGEIGVANAAGNKVAQVGGVRFGLHMTELAWAPDGAQLAFAQVEAEPYLGSVAANGTGLKQLYRGPTRWPDWGRRR